MPQGKGTYGSQVGRPPKKENADDMAFNALPKDDGGALYTESTYNTLLTPEEKGSYDRKSSRLLNKMYKDDMEKGLFDDKITFDNYRSLISETFVSERVQMPRDDDPEYYEEIGSMLNNIYEGDFQQMIASADQWSPSQDKAFEKEAVEGNIKPAPLREY
tara:strand:- start:1046 stop:1525 length:480 start_codon:yes stop_codon:yes gene_type:complete